MHGADELPADHQPYLVKFRAPHDDPADVGRIELAYHLMAKAAGLEVAEARLFLGKKTAYFGTRRFDRGDDGIRVHVHSLGGLLHASHRVASMSYIDLMRATWRLTKDQRQVARAYRQMVFNVLAHNRDDHVKNFAFSMRPDGSYVLTPAYDLTFSYGPGGEHWMSVAGEGRSPGKEHLLQVARIAGIDAGPANGIIDEVRRAVSGWRQHAKDVDLSAKSRENIAKVLGLEAAVRRAPRKRRAPSKRSKRKTPVRRRG